MDATNPDPDHPVSRFRRMFASIGPDRPMPLEGVYDPDVTFEDPLHRLQGLDELRAYFERLNAGLVAGRFVFEEPLVGEGAAALPWVMHLELRRSRAPVVVPGCSHLRFSSRVTSQRDYFDAGALIYERVPVLGGIVRRIKTAI